MFFSSKPKLVLYLKNQFLVFYNNQGESASLEFPQDVLKNQKIINQQKFEDLVKEFLLSLKIKNQKAVLLVTEEIIFQKTMLEAIKDVLAKFKCVVVKIVPSSLFENIKTEGLTKDQIKQILANFSTKLVQAKNMQKEGFSMQTYFLILLMTIFGFVILIGILLAIGLIKNPTENNQITSQVKPTEAPKELPSQSTNSASLVALEKKDIKIQVLNGSGIAGQAGKVKDLLGKIDYTDIETGNLARAETKETVINFSSRVLETQKKEIITTLEKIFAEVSVGTKSASLEFDSVIITGEEK